MNSGDPSTHFVQMKRITYAMVLKFTKANKITNKKQK